MGPWRESGDDELASVVAAAGRAEPLEHDLAMHRVERTLFPQQVQPLRLGRYVVLQHLASGSSGSVYGAFDTRLDRKVALKILHAGGDDPPEVDAQQRLVCEAQAVAKVSHPHVVTVYDVGVFDEGTGAWANRVFIAMEFVEGVRLSQWLAAEPRTWRRIVDMLVQAGRGLSAAHSAGLVHRDFKPANVLIGADERARVIDFGLAHVAGSDGPANTADALDDDGGLAVAPVGTLAYIAPEQFETGVADARSDEFSFCVTLFEALYGERPFAGLNIEAIQERVARAEIRKPASSRVVPGRIRRAIVRGLSRDPADRFESMAALLAALEPRAIGRRGTVAAAGIVALGGAAASYALQPRNELCAGAREGVAAMWQPRRKSEIRAAFLATQTPFATHAYAEVERVVDRYVAEWDEVYTDVCHATRTRGVQSEELLDVRMTCLDRQLEHLGKLVEVFEAPNASVVENAAAATHALDEPSQCRRLDMRSASAQVPTGADEAAQIDAVFRSLAKARARLAAGQFDAAHAVAEAASQAARGLGRQSELAQTLLTLGRVQVARGHDDEAEQIFYEAAVAAGEGHDDRAAARAFIALTRTVGDHLARPDAGLALARGAEVAIARIADADDLHAMLLTVRGGVLNRQGRYEDARAQLERAVVRQEAAFGADDPRLANALNDLGIALKNLGRYAEAKDSHARALAIRERVLGPHHPDVANSIGNLGIVESIAGNYSMARQHFLRGLAIQERALEPNHPYLGHTLNNLGLVSVDLGELEAAMDYHRRALEIRTAALGPTHPNVGDSLHNLAEVLTQAGKLEAAEGLYERDLRLQREAFGAEHPNVAGAHRKLGALLFRSGRHREAADHLGRAVTILEGHRPQPTDALALRLVSARFELAQVHVQLGQRARAWTLANEARDAARAARDAGLAQRETIDAWLQQHPQGG